MPIDHKKLVLLVEDDVFVTMTFVKVFEDQEDYFLDTALTISLAIQKIRVIAYDLVFLDMKIGHSYAGMDVLRELNRVTSRSEADGRLIPNTQVVIMSGSVPLQDVMSEAHELGVVSFINKPVQFNEPFIRKILQRLRFPIAPRKTV